MRRWLACLLALLALPAFGRGFEYPPTFKTRQVPVEGASIYVRSGGQGPAVLLLHGFGDTGDMWAPLAVELARNHTVVVPDLRGLGLSSKPAGGYDKRTQAGDIVGVLDALGIGHTDLVAHDIGNMVAFAVAARYPDRVGRVVLIDAPIPGVGPWDEILKSPMLWHFRFGGPDMERLVKGRERIYLNRFWNDFAATPTGVPEAARVHYARLYALPGAMHAGFSQFAAFDQDAADNRAFLANGKLPEPVLALGGEKSFGTMMATVAQGGFVNVQGGIVPNSGHWIMDENPAATVKLVRDFLDGAPSAAP